MTWSDFYLACLIVGFALSVLSLFGGHRHIHLPHVKLPGAHLHGSNLPWFNAGTIAAFLAWFGGTGYLLRHIYGVWFIAALAIASISGIGAASVAFWFLAKLMAHDRPLDPSDYQMTGVLGRISSPIRAGGTGEMIYSQEGTRRAAGVRSEEGEAIAKGAEVIVTRYEKGIAYVRRWEDPLAEPDARNSQEKSL